MESAWQSFMADHLPYLSLDKEGRIASIHAIIGLGLEDTRLMIGKDWQDIFQENPQLHGILHSESEKEYRLQLIGKHHPYQHFEALLCYDAAKQLWRAFLLLDKTQSLATFASPEYPQALLDCTTDSTILIGLDYRILGFNKKTDELIQRLRGVSMKLGDSIFDYDDPKLRQTFTDTFQKVVETRQEIVHQNEVSMSHGSIWVEVKYTPVFSRDGQLIGVSFNSTDITAEKTAEKKLKEQEEKYRLLFENSAEAILLTAPDGQVLSANPEACRIFGMTEAELQALGRGGLVDISDPRLKPALEQRAKMGFYRGELTFIRKNGEKFPGEVTSTIYHKPNGELRTSMLIRDISQKAEFEKALHNSHELLRKLSEKLPGALFQFQATAEGEYMFPFSSAAFKRLFGLDTETDLTQDAQPAFDRIHPEDMGQIYADIVAGMQQLHEWSFSFRVQLPNAPIRWLHGNSTPERQADGSVIWHGYVVDITEKRAEQENKAFQAFLLQNVGDAIIATDLSGNISYWNRAAEKLYGWPAEEALQKNMYQIHTIYGNQQTQAQAASSLLADGSWEGEIQQITQSGEYKPFLSSVSLLRDALGQPNGMIAVNRDISARKQAEEQVKKRDETLSKIAWIQSHRVRSPVASIIGLVNLLDLNPENELLEEILAKVQQAAKQLDDVIHEIVYLASTIEQNQQEKL